MGSVWLAEDSRLHRQVALKMLLAPGSGDAVGRERLLREARAAAALNHPHIAAVHDVLDIDGDIVIVFEYVEGETLASRLRRGPLPTDEAVALAGQMAAALAAAHGQGVIHRDLKPTNVVIGAGAKLKVLDFGIARHTPVDPTTTGLSPQPATTDLALAGTPGYAAPEQWLGRDVNARADLYALGVMLFEMAAGRRPFDGPDPTRAAAAAINEDAPALSAVGVRVPADYELLTSRLLARDPAARPVSATDVLTELTRLREGDTSRDRESWWRRPAAVAALALAVVILAVLGWLISSSPASRPSAVPGPAAAPVVAVLPLANMSGDPSKEYLAAGIADSLITSLAGLPSITVLSRAAVAEARTRSPEPAKLAAELGANWLVEGSVQQAGDQLRVAVNLVRADRSIAWADSFEGALARIFELQTRLAGAVGAAMTVHAAVRDQALAPGAPTSNPQALTAYWQGRALQERRDVQGNLAAAIGAFQESIALDPNFALGHAALGEAYWQLYTDRREPGLAQKAIDEGTAALRLDSNQPEVRYTLAVTLAGTGKYDDAASELRRALALRPNYDEARRQLGQVLAQQGKIDEALGEFRKAIALRPTYWGHYSAMGFSLWQANRIEDAAAAFRKVTELQPDNYLGFQQLGTVTQLLGDSESALRYYARAIQLRPNAPAYSNVGALHHARGEYAAAVESYRRAIELRPNSHVTHRNLGDALLRMGQAARARDAYRQAVALAEAELSVNPTDARTIAVLAVYLEKSGDDAAAIERMRQALDLAPDDATVLRWAAVVHSLAGRHDAALDALEKAAARGMRRETAAGEEDFNAIRSSPRFKALVSAPAAARPD